METQDFIKLLEDMKKAGCFYNDADFCRKMDIATSRLSMMKSGQRPVSERFVHEMRETFPDYFDPKTIDMTDPMADLIALARYNLERGHDVLDLLPVAGELVAGHIDGGLLADDLAAVGHPDLDEVRAVLAAEAAHLIGECCHFVRGFCATIVQLLCDKSRQNLFSLSTKAKQKRDSVAEIPLSEWPDSNGRPLAPHAEGQRRCFSVYSSLLRIGKFADCSTISEILHEKAPTEGRGSTLCVNEMTGQRYGKKSNGDFIFLLVELRHPLQGQRHYPVAP